MYYLSFFVSVILSTIFFSYFLLTPSDNSINEYKNAKNYFNNQVTVDLAVKQEQQKSRKQVYMQTNILQLEQISAEWSPITKNNKSKWELVYETKEYYYYLDINNVNLFNRGTQSFNVFVKEEPKTEKIKYAIINGLHGGEIHNNFSHSEILISFTFTGKTVKGTPDVKYFNQYKHCFDITGKKLAEHTFRNQKETGFISEDSNMRNLYIVAQEYAQFQNSTHMP